VVIDPAQDLHLGSASHAVVGEVGLPALVGQLGGESDIRRLGPFVGLGCDHTGADEDPAHR